MLNTLSLKTKIIGGFLIVAAITLIVGIVGWNGVKTVASHVRDVGDSETAIKSLLTMSVAQAEIDSAENAMLIPDATANELQTQYDSITASFKEADDERKAYEETTISDDEKTTLNSEFAPAWDKWRQANTSMVSLSKQYQVAKSPDLRNQMIQLANATYYEDAKKPLDKLVQMNESQASQTLINADKQAGTSTVVSMIGMFLGTLLALFLGIFLSISITRPMLAAVNGLTESAQQVASASEQLSAASQQLAEANAEQASSIEETSSTLEESSSMIQQNTDNTKQAAQLASQARGSADKGNGDMGEMMSSMNEIKKSSDQIAKIIKVIDDIAFQTNILALNAAVEAARAGDAGMGFAVVAEEVRNLAQRSAQAAKDTAAMIEGNIDLSEKGVDASRKVGEELADIASGVKKVTELIDEISAASQEQTQGINQINKAIMQMEKAIQESASTAEESASASEELSAQAQSMNEIVGQLKNLVEGGSGRTSVASANILRSRDHQLQAKQVGSRAKSGNTSLALKDGGVSSGRAKTRIVDPNEAIPLDEGLDDF